MTESQNLEGSQHRGRNNNQWEVWSCTTGGRIACESFIGACFHLMGMESYSKVYSYEFRNDSRTTLVTPKVSMVPLHALNCATPSPHT